MRPWVSMVMWVVPRVMPKLVFMLNVDQVPVNLDFQTGRSFVFPEDARSGRIQISAPPGADKRMATLQVAIAYGAHEQPPLGLLFRGMGRCRKAEYARWPAELWVDFQKNAWFSGVMCHAWAVEVLKPWVERVVAPSDIAVL